MGRQEGIIPLSGKVGDLIFSNRKGKHHAKKKSDKPMNQTAATKKSSTDFGEASKIGARIRNAFTPMVKLYGDTTIVSRVIQRVLAIFKTIPSTALGQKSLAQGDISAWKDFQFNAWIRLDSLLHKVPTVELGAPGLTISFPKDAIKNMFRTVGKGEMIVLQLKICNLSLSDGEDEIIPIKDLLIPLNQVDFNGAKLQVPLSFKGDQMILVALGIHYLGGESMIGDRTKRAAAILYATHLKNGVEVIFVPPLVEASAVVPQTAGLEWELS